MDETAKLMRAKMYIDKLANGINPIDDTLASNADVINAVANNPQARYNKK